MRGNFLVSLRDEISRDRVCLRATEFLATGIYQIMFEPNRHLLGVVLTEKKPPTFGGHKGLVHFYCQGYSRFPLGCHFSKGTITIIFTKK